MSVGLLGVGLMSVSLMKQHLVLGLVVGNSSPCCGVTLVFLILVGIGGRLFDGMEYGR